MNAVVSSKTGKFGCYLLIDIEVINFIDRKLIIVFEDNSTTCYDDDDIKISIC